MVLSWRYGVHIHQTGPLSWNGELAFWPRLLAFALELVLDGILVFQNIRYRPDLDDMTLRKQLMSS